MKFISGLANCHLPGLYSLVISERVSPQVGMKRVFYAGPECKLSLFDDCGADFRLKPHNHRQNLQLSRLFGTVFNVEFHFDRWGTDYMWRYKFDSALINGKFGLKRMEGEFAWFKPVAMDGAPIKMHWSDVHTVTAEPESAWLVEEFEKAPAAGIERCWAVTPRLQLSSDGLYRPLSRDELNGIEALLNHKTTETFICKS